MLKKEPLKELSQNIVNKPIISLGNSSKKQLKIEAKSWVKEAQKESKIWENYLPLRIRKDADDGAGNARKLK